MSSTTVRKVSGPAEDRVRRWALIGGIALLLMAAVAVFANFLVLEKLVTPGDALTTASDIASSKGLFQAGIAGWFAIAALDVLAALALFHVVRPVSARLAAVGAWSRTLYGVVLGAATLQLLAILGLLDGPMTAASSAEVLHKTEAFTDIWHAGLVLFGVHLMVVGYLAFRSGYIPKPVGAVVAIAGFGYLFDAAVRVAVADPSLSLSVITGLGEFVLGVWLVTRSRRIALPVSARGANDERAGRAQPVGV